MKKYRRRVYRKSILRSIGEFLLTGLFLAALLLAVVFVDNLNVQKLSGPVKVTDGDSLRVGDKRLRLLGIDAPELVQMCKRNGVDWGCGSEARRALSDMVGADLECSIHGNDRYHRQLVICWSGGVEINAAMVEAGWAVNYGGYASEERLARKSHHGVWAGPFVTPQEWRRAQKLQGLDEHERELADSLNIHLKRWWRGVFD